jgi:hypothetical protein
MMEVTMRKSLAFTSAFLFVFAGLHLALAQESTSSKSNLSATANSPFESFAGTWEGKCQDQKTFVVVDLRPSGTGLNGTISIGNMHGDDEGACMMVLNAPVPEHAQKISDAVANNKVLTFNGSKRANGTFARFELRLVGNNLAQLKLLDTPAADHPWQLVRTQRAD